MQRRSLNKKKLFLQLKMLKSPKTFFLFLQPSQDLLNQQQNCKRCLSVIERNHHTLQRLISNSKGLKNFDQSLLQKRVLEIQSSAQVSPHTSAHGTFKSSKLPLDLKLLSKFQTLLKEVGEWRRQEEANTCLRRRFEESRHELERVLKKAHDCFRETGEPEELLKKHTVGSFPLKSCNL